MLSTASIETTVPLTIVRVDPPNPKKVRKKKPDCEKANGGPLIFGEKSVTLFIAETVEKYEFLKSTNKALKLAKEYSEIEPHLVSEEDYDSFKKLINITKDHFFSERHRMQCLCVRHVEGAIEILDESLRRLENI